MNGAYEVLRVLGKGKFSVVYQSRALDPVRLGLERRKVMLRKEVEVEGVVENQDGSKKTRMKTVLVEADDPNADIVALKKVNINYEDRQKCVREVDLLRKISSKTNASYFQSEQNGT